MVFSEDRDQRSKASELLGEEFGRLENREQAWEDLISLTQDQDSYVRRGAADSLGSAFPHFPDKQKAWEDLISLTQDQDSYVRRGAADSLGSAFPHAPDKKQAWEDLIKLTRDLNGYVRRGAASSLGSAFPHFPDKQKAWEDLIKLTQDQDSYVRRGAAYSLRSAFPHAPDKKQAWEDLIKLTQDLNGYVRRGAASSLGSAFPHAPDKKQAWEDLIKLTQDQDSYVRRGAAYSLGSAFPHFPDKQKAWEDLIKLTQDQDSYVRSVAFYSLGKASIHKASSESKNKDTLKEGLEAAVRYFEKSAQEHKDSPARFCYPFYRSYLAITFHDDPKETVERYMTEAKVAVGVSASKKELLKAVENLAKALHEAQMLKDKPFREIQQNFEECDRYCNRAAEHMAAVEDKAPDAVKLLRSCNPMIRNDIQAIIMEIREIASQICHATTNKGPEAQSFCGEMRKAARSLSEEDMKISDLLSFLKEKCLLLPEGDKDLVMAQLHSVDRMETSIDKLGGIKTVFSFFLSRIQKDDEFLRRLREMNQKIDSLQLDITSLRQILLDRFNSNERTILSAILDRLDKDKLETVQALIDAVDKERIPKELIEETLKATKELITEMKSMHVQDLDIAKSVVSWEKAINSPELNIENAIKVTIPIIPFLLTYEGAYKFQTGMKLDDAYENLCQVWKKLSDRI